MIVTTGLPEDFRAVRRSIVVLAMALFVAGAAAGHAHASFPGENGRLVFSWGGRSTPQDALTTRLVTVNSAGGDLRVIAGCQYWCRFSWGDWSPSGRRLVYDHDYVGRREWIVTVRPGGSHRKVVFRSRTVSGSPVRRLIASPVWSPDGGRIAFVDYRWSNRAQKLVSDIYVIRRNGTHLTRVTRTQRSEGQLDWSSRNRLVFVSKGDLFTMRPNGLGLRRLTHTDLEEGGPDWAPGGGRLAFSRGNDLWIMRASGKNASMITSGHSPTWAPDGSLIAFRNLDGAIHTVKPSGAEDTFLSNFVPATDGLDWQPR